MIRQCHVLAITRKRIVMITMAAPNMALVARTETISASQMVVISAMPIATKMHMVPTRIIVSEV